eukprot:TRINITY_DN4558_c0_g1_i1.p1 TRINITY_DN4558_c0_g1~~TRINITY_DN4558_c0_g1_i1.p1  ORF type:complete len:354 (-),score=16.55 TRINITY_DN4558_c0_g1_i1:313-1374(-)
MIRSQIISLIVIILQVVRCQSDLQDQDLEELLSNDQQLLLPIIEENEDEIEDKIDFQVAPMSVCRWDSNSKSCRQDALKMIQLLTASKNPFGYMMRCSYAYNQSTCENMETVSTCVWQEQIQDGLGLIGGQGQDWVQGQGYGQCRISSKYLAGWMGRCMGETNCSQELSNVVSNTTYVNPSKILQPLSPSCLFDELLVRNFTLCSLMQDALDCYELRNYNTHYYYSIGQNRDQKWEVCTSFKSQEHEFGLEVVEDMAYLMGQKTYYRQKAMINLQFIERLLKLSIGNLYMYEQCDHLHEYACLSDPQYTIQKQENSLTSQVQSDDGNDGKKCTMHADLLWMTVFGVILVFLMQ